MNKDDMISDEQLGAFTDGELDADEENRIFTRAEQDPELDARLCQHRKLKELVQHAYRDLPEPRGRGSSAMPRRRLFGVAAAALLVIGGGFLAGWLASETARVRGGDAALAGNEQSSQVLIHVTSSDRAHMEQALQRARELMEGTDRQAGAAVEIVANEGGLNLLRSDVTPFAAEVRALAEQDVLFFACARAIERLEERGVEIQLLPEANRQFTALDRVVSRLQDGWQYIKI